MLISAQTLWDKEQAQGHRHKKDGHTKDLYTHRETGRQIEIEEQTERQTDIRKEKQTDRYGNVFFSRCIDNRRR